ERVCVLAQNDVAYVELYGACARQGIVAYPINWRLTGAEVERVVDRAQPKMMVIDQTTQPLVADWLGGKAVPHRYRPHGEAGDGVQVAAGLYALGRGHAAAAPASAPPADASPCSSPRAGAGVPRGAVRSHGNVVPANLTAIAALGLTER